MSPTVAFSFPTVAIRPQSNAESRSTASSRSSSKTRLPCLKDGSWPKLASFDWPPPPSPAQPVEARSQSGLGATAPEFVKGQHWARPTEKLFRADLWAHRADIERAKLRTIAPFPFFGKPMRFQDHYSALQISDDGRFSLSIELKEASDLYGLCEDLTLKSSEGKHIVTYEGILAKPDLDDPIGECYTELFTCNHPETGTIEGKALVRHEVLETAGSTQIIGVRDDFKRFAITVTPFFEPKDATVRPMTLRLTEEEEFSKQTRVRRLQYVGESAGGNSPKRACKLEAYPIPVRRATRPKFVRNATALSAVAEGRLGSPKFSGGTFPTLSASASAPTLPALGFARAHPTDGNQMQGGDWNDFYRERSKKALRA